MKDLAIMYHYILEPELWTGSVPLSPKNFREQVQWAKENYAIITSKDFEEILDKPKCVITFDDATKDQYTNAYRILKEENIRGYFAIMLGPIATKKIPIFHLVHAILSKVQDEKLWDDLRSTFEIASNIEEMSSIYYYEKNKFRRYNKYVLNFLLPEDESRVFLEDKMRELYGSLDDFIDEFYINPNEIKEMHQNGMEIGVHCVHHRPYKGDAQTFYDNEIKPCYDYLTDLLGEAPKWYSPAFGGGQNTATMLKELTPILSKSGFIGGFTTIEGFCDLNSDAFWHNRVDCNKLELFLQRGALKV
ncbi:polysaccharide deacetylase family protein [Lysinibacillus fusiformis]|uniref:polysaccharide deacetylase family protein n=1 Tax=Lysinibacillus fusiformis TaxID=28031 RepID=UPI00381B02EA